MNATLPVTVTWICPTCGRTVHLDGPPADVDCCLEVVKTRHQRAHQPPRPRRGDPRGNRA